MISLCLKIVSLLVCHWPVFVPRSKRMVVLGSKQNAIATLVVDITVRSFYLIKCWALHLYRFIYWIHYVVIGLPRDFILINLLWLFRILVHILGGLSMRIIKRFVIPLNSSKHVCSGWIHVLLIFPLYQSLSFFLIPFWLGHCFHAILAELTTIST